VRTLYYMVLKSFLPVFLVALLFFVLLFQVVDLFGNLPSYLNNGVGLRAILHVAWLYVPKCVSYSVPVSLLFAVAFTLGTFYTHNELISVFGAGISLYQLIVPFVFAGAVLSAGGLWFDENVVIDTFRQKSELTRELLNQRTSYSNTNVTVISRGSRIVYNADYYNDSTKTLSKLIVLQRGDDGRFLRRLDAEWASWQDAVWELHNVRVFRWNEEGTWLTEEQESVYRWEELDEEPSTFRKESKNVDEMRLSEAQEWIESRRRAGLPFREALTEYYNRYSFALTPLMVAFISSAVGGRFRKNILLMSLLTSLVFSVVYYVTQMVSVIFAKLGLIPPLAGAWGAFLLFVFATFWLFRYART
jgi:lipopolysaccharide export system permease protein